MTTTMRFCCPLCGCTSFEAVQIDRPGQAPYMLPLFACCGCSAAFTDPVRFTLRDRGAYQRMMLPRVEADPRDTGGTLSPKNTSESQQPATRKPLKPIDSNAQR